MKKFLLFVALCVGAGAPLAAQTIAPAQIKPAPTDGPVLTTVDGKTAWANPAGSGVSSVFGRTGAVTPEAGDYLCAQVTGAICTLPSLNYQTVESNGSGMTQRPSLNLIPGTPGSVACVDNPVSGSTDCTITGGATGGITWSIADVSGSRLPNVVYQNTTTNPMFIGGSIGTSGSSVGDVEVSQGPTAFSLPFMSWANSVTATVSGGDGAFSAVIMPGYYYMVQPSGAANQGVRHWTQITGTGTGGGGSTAYLVAGTGITITGTGSAGDPYIISTTTPFSITSFTGGSSVELGHAVANPAFAATYSTTPASAQITNTDSIDSPLTLTTPFTSGTVTGSFSHSAVATTTFTLSATQGTTQTATQAITWNPRLFGGVGASGATSTVTASGSTAVLSTTDALPSLQLGAEAVGQSFGPFSPTGQCVYLLLMSGSHTFIDAGTGFPFAFNAPITVTFVNQNGVTVTMYLYQSTNPLTGTFTPKVAS